MRKFLTASFLLLVAATVVFAQGAGGAGGGANRRAGGGMAMSSNTILLKGSKGLFALRNGVLVKFDIATLKPAQDTLQLFGPMPEMPQAQPAAADPNAAAGAAGAGAGAVNMQDMRAFMQEVTKRTAPAIMVESGNYLLIVIGDNYAKIDEDTMKVVKHLSLTNPNAVDNGAAAQGPRMAAVATTAPGYLLDAKTLYLLRTDELIAINIADDTLAGRSDTPKELTLPAINMGNMMGGGRGGNGAAGGAAGGRRGGRGGRGGNQGGQPAAGQPAQ